MKLHVENCAAGAGIVAGVLTGDVAMLGSALGSDTIVEVARGPLIPGFAAVKAAAVRRNGALQKPVSKSQGAIAGKVNEYGHSAHA